ncbi:MAG: hypothetical protein JWM09_421 [Francisellaceae bacterium]|nr:hypothetical protein [Francisellaceae bacterium]
MNEAVWVLLANASSASFYSVSEKNRHFNLIKKIDHPESKLKERELDTDRPGHFHKAKTTIRGAFEEPLSHKYLQRMDFAKQINLELENGRINSHYKGIIIIAEPHFYGLINTNAPQEVQSMIKFHLPKDYTHYSEKELITQLEMLLKHELNLIFTS